MFWIFYVDAAKDLALSSMANILAQAVKILKDAALVEHNFSFKLLFQHDFFLKLTTHFFLV